MGAGAALVNLAAVAQQGERRVSGDVDDVDRSAEVSVSSTASPSASREGPSTCLTISLE